ncbi:hypothetical protein PSTT_14738 [Puccinia striiformis]|uniref:Uncharacterized protein n=1 Tax=Puccinia striiformis TaxID=27350 RepID=A0A2S4UKY3_9BASI|nr:hypothetical protein PSTT_14738 [Puccinia striiformis]
MPQYLARLDASGALRFHLSIPHSHVYPHRRYYYVSSKETFRPFAEEVAQNIVRKPNLKVVIWVDMEDPCAQLKAREVDQHQDNSLAIAVGSDEAIQSLERYCARTEINRHSDTTGNPVAPWVVRLRNHLLQATNTRPSEVVFVPSHNHENMAMRLTHKRLWAWARVLQQMDAGNITDANREVSLDRPPTGVMFIFEPRALVSPVKHRAGRAAHNRTGNPSTSQSPESAPAIPPQSAPAPAIPYDSADSAPATAVHASLVQSASPPHNRPQPDESHDPAGSHGPAVSPRNPGPISPCTAAPLIPMTPTLVGSSASSDVEFPTQENVQPAQPQALARGGSHLTSRKVARTPFGDSMRDFGDISNRRGGSPSPSRTHKSIKRPLTEEGRELSIEEFWMYCDLDPMDTMCHAVLVVHHISHWGFFRALGVAQLVGLGFPIGPATQIYNGALQLEETMVQKR